MKIFALVGSNHCNDTPAEEMATSDDHASTAQVTLPGHVFGRAAPTVRQPHPSSLVVQR